MDAFLGVMQTGPETTGIRAMSDDLKPLLLELLSKTDTLLNDVAALKDGQARL